VPRSVRTGALAIVLLVTTPLVAQAQTARIPRIGVMLAASRDESRPYAEAFRRGLKDLGYVEDRTVMIELRFLGRAARSFLRARVRAGAPASRCDRGARDGSFASGSPGHRNNSIIIVTAGNPVGDALITSFPRPGGNVTGPTMTVDAGIAGKLLDLLKAAVPRVSRVALAGIR
jgi:putative tryptophan/tyrosine transport system substrate-binding protein